MSSTTERNRLTDDQYILLGKINQYSEPNRRTDRLAICLASGKAAYGPWTNSHVGFIGLQLRALGLVTTYKDNGPYALWNVTPLGKAKLLEEANELRKVALAAMAKPVPPVKQYAVYDSETSAFERYESLDKANKVANEWVRESEGEVFVMQIVKTLKSKLVVEEV